MSNISLDGCPYFMAFQTGKGGYSEKLSSLGKKSASQGSKFKFEFGSTCDTRCKFLGALPKF